MLDARTLAMLMAQDPAPASPEPWKIEHIHGTSDKDNIYVTDKNGDLVASVHAYGSSDKALRAVANARLVLAAHALLDIARAVVTAFDNDMFKGHVEQALYDGARVAIDIACPHEKRNS